VGWSKQKDYRTGCPLCKPLIDIWSGIKCGVNTKTYSNNKEELKQFV
jgi:hypothetical protein